eukprot:GFKZ01010453.1.p1 GENE.GFKZ01010453.1~~GFKZ01010453.1.p1  ORF type:complete len:307 (-),score=42.05 GFKZ01010453.1:387-1307(-)
MATLIIIGGTGELGRKTVEAAQSADETGWPGNIIATYHNSPPPHYHSRVTWMPLDCSDQKAVRSLIASQNALGAVIYCAVPKHGGAAGKGGDSVRVGIVDDVVNCAEACVMVGARFVAVSTDLVYDGRLPVGQRYCEGSLPAPINAYGRYKVEMEDRLGRLSGSVVIARTSLILTMDKGGDYGKGVRFVVDCLEGKHGEIEIFTDELRNMSFADELGLALVELAKKDCPLKGGVINLVSDEVTTRWELAKRVAAKLGMEDKLGGVVKSGLSAKSGLDRPLNCALSTELRSRVLKTNIRGLSERLPL